MEYIQLKKKVVVNININDRDCVMAIDTLAIDHFQRTNKVGLAKAFEMMQKGNTNIAYKLICSFVRDKKTNQILGHKFFKEFDEFDLIQALTPALKELSNQNLPEPKNESEKK